jgi:DNA invertase Pin-like site-specific DNA recombinase
MIYSRVTERKALREAFDYCSEGDVLMVTRLDRLRQFLKKLIDHLIAGREAETKWEELAASHSSLGSGSGRPVSPTTSSRNT